MKYSVDAHIGIASKPSRTLFDNIRKKIFELHAGIIEVPTKNYIGYRCGLTFAEVYLLKDKLKISLRPIGYIDPLNRVIRVSEKYRWTLDRKIYCDDTEMLEYVFGIIQQSFKDVFNRLNS